MQNVKTFTRLEDIQQQACDWIARIDRGLTQQEERALCIWMAQSNAHYQTLQQLATVWDDLGCLKKLKETIE